MVDRVSQLLSVQEAQARLLSFFPTLTAEEIPISVGVGRTLAKNIFAPVDLPRFSNSSMDGFAVKASDLSILERDLPVELQVIVDIPAGAYVNTTIAPGQAARIMTGAPIPPGADAVVPVEDTNFDRHMAAFEVPTKVQIRAKVKTGDNVRQAGEDVRQGDTVIPSGRRMRAVEVGFLAMLGIKTVAVNKRPRVAILSSGDELASIDHELTAGKIYDSNGPMLQAAIESAGGEALRLLPAADQEDAIRALLDQAVEERVDIILTSAGVSVGAFDFVRNVVASQGRLDFWRVNMRPGKPLAFGFYREVPFIGLPGNPVSAFVGFEVFVRPALGKMLGLTGPIRTVLPARLAEPIESDGRESFLRAQINHNQTGWLARLTGHQGSGNLHSLVLANAFIRVPSGVKFLPEGAEVEAWLLGDLQ